MDYNVTRYMAKDGYFTNAIVINVLRGRLSVWLTIIKEAKGHEMTTCNLALSQIFSPVPSLMYSPTDSSTGSTTGDSDDSYDLFAGLMSAPHSDGSEEELTMTPARLADRSRSVAMAHAQTHPYGPTSHFHRGSGLSDPWQLLEYLPRLDRIEAKEKVAAEAEKKARWNGNFLLKLLETGGFQKELVEELRTVINMVKHMNNMLYKGKNDALDWKIKPDVMEELEEVTIQVIHFFDEFGNSLNRGIDKIHEIKAHLPSLKPETDPYQWRTALRVWNARIMKELAPVRKREKQLFEGLAEFYDAVVYHAFLQVRKRNPKHDMCIFTEHFDAIYHAIEFLSEAYATIDREMHKLGSTYQAARELLLSMPEVYHSQYKEQVMHDRLEARMKVYSPKALDDVTRALSTAVHESDIAIKTPKVALKNAMAMTKEDEAEDDREFQAIVVHLQRMKLEKAAAMANAAGLDNAIAASRSKDKSKAGSISTTFQAMERFRKKHVSPKKNFSF